MKQATSSAIFTLLHVLEALITIKLAPFQQHKVRASKNETLIQIRLGPHSSKASLFWMGFIYTQTLAIAEQEVSMDHSINFLGLGRKKLGVI